MRVTTYMAVLATAVLLIIGSTVFASDFKVRVITHGVKSKSIEVIGLTTDSGITMLEVSACGTVLEFSAPKDLFDSPAFLEVAVTAIDKECK